MAINPANLMPQLSPLAPLKPMDFGGSGSSMERQKLKLMRQQFEETKRRNREEEELRRISEAGEMRRAEMQMERERAQTAATLAAQQQRHQYDLDSERRKNAAVAYGDFYKAQDANDIAGMAAAGNRLREFGGFADDLGTDEQGRPSYRLGTDAAAHAEREARLDAQAAGAGQQAPEGAVWLPPGLSPESLGESLRRLNALGYDRTQEGVVDHGEFLDQRRAQAAPALEASRAGLPEGAYRDSAEATDEGVLQLGLSPTESWKLSQSSRKEAHSVIKDELDADREFQKTEAAAQRAYDKEMRDAKRDEDKQAVAAAKDGRSNAASQWEKEGLHKIGQAEHQADQIISMLSNKDTLQHRQVAHLFVNLKGSVGPQSDKEIDAVFGTEGMSVPQQIFDKIHQVLVGGLSDDVRASLIDIVSRSVEANDERVYSYLDSLANTLESDNTDPEAKRGWLQFADSIDKDLVESWNAARLEEGLPTLDDLKEGSAPASPVRGQDISYELEPGAAPARAALHEGITADDEFMDVFTEHAINAGIDPELVLPLINHESGGNAQARNAQSGASGLIQFLDSTAKRYGFESAEEFGKLSAAEQAPYIVQYLVDSGVTAEHDQGDIYVAISAPAALNESDDFEVYKKGTDAYRMNQTWDLDRDGVITRGELYRWGMGERGGKSKKPAASAAKPAAKAGRDDDESLLE
jgi:hypothetical protein